MQRCWSRDSDRDGTPRSLQPDQPGKYSIHIWMMAGNKVWSLLTNTDLQCVYMQEENLWRFWSSVDSFVFPPILIEVGLYCCIYTCCVLKFCCRSQDARKCYYETKRAAVKYWTAREEFLEHFPTWYVCDGSVHEMFDGPGGSKSSSPTAGQWNNMLHNSCIL